MNYKINILLVLMLVLKTDLNAEVFDGYTLFSPTGGGPSGATGGTSYLYDNDYNIIHAHGKVRIDTLDHSGIFNTEIQKHTHKLRVIKKINHHYKSIK